MDLESLLTSRGEDAPSGENLEYDMDFINLELAAAPGEEKQAGDEILPAEDNDWKDVRDKALGVLERAHDMRAAAHLAKAAAYLEGLTGLAEVIGYVRSVLEEFWATCHPELDADDDNDPTMRINALQAFGSNDGLLPALRRAPLTESRTFGRISLRDAMISAGEADGEGPDAGTVAAAFKDTAADVLTQRLAAVRRMVADVKAIDAKFAEETPGNGPALDELAKMLRLIEKHLAAHAPKAAAAADDGDEDGADDAGGAGSGDAPAAAAPAGGGRARIAVGGISSDRDVRAAIDNIISYYRKAEPSSPIPVLLARVKRLVGKDFMAILQDIAPDGIDQYRNIGGLSEDDESEQYGGDGGEDED